MANKLINNYGGDTRVSKEIKKRCFNWFKAAFIAEERDDQSLARIADNMLTMLGGQARRKDAIRIALYHYQNGVCNLCGQQFPIQIFHIDHIEAKTRNQNNKLSNLQVLCSACNGFKSDRPMHKVRDLRRKAGLTIFEPRYYFEKDQNKLYKSPKPVKKAVLKPHVKAGRNGYSKLNGKKETDINLIIRISKEHSSKESPMLIEEITDKCTERVDRLAREKGISLEDARLQVTRNFVSNVNRHKDKDVPFETYKARVNNKGPSKLHIYYTGR